MEEALRFLAARGRRPRSSPAAAWGRPPTTSPPRSSGAFQGRAMVLDEALEERIAEILRPLLSRWPDLDPEAIRALQPQAGGRARGRDGARARSAPRPGSSCRRPSTAGRPTIVVAARARRASCSRCGRAAVRHRGVPRGASRGAVELRQEMLRLFGIPESEIAETLRVAERRRHRPRRAGDHDLPAPRRDRGRDALRARRGSRSTSASRRRARAPSPTRCSPTTARRSTSRSPTLLRSAAAARSPRPSRAPAGCWPAG